jgi:Transcriptional regulatory protein, C terminal
VPGEEEAVVHTDDFDVDLAGKRVTISNGEIRLTPTEWAIVEILVRNPGKLVSQRQLLQEVWGPQYEKETTTYASISPRSARSSSPIRRSRASSSRKPDGLPVRADMIVAPMPRASA